jgi:hypothetical protein
MLYSKSDNRTFLNKQFACPPKPVVPASCRSRFSLMKQPLFKMPITNQPNCQRSAFLSLTFRLLRVEYFSGSAAVSQAIGKEFFIFFFQRIKASLEPEILPIRSLAIPTSPAQQPVRNLSVLGSCHRFSNARIRLQIIPKLIRLSTDHLTPDE